MAKDINSLISELLTFSWFEKKVTTAWMPQRIPLCTIRHLRMNCVPLEALEKLKSGLSKMECAVCMYEMEFEHSEDPYDNRVHPFKQQF